MNIRPAMPEDFAQIATWNRELQEDEGTKVMTLDKLEERFKRWLNLNYKALVFIVDNPVGYALFRPTHIESEGDGIYLRHFYIDRDSRRRGYGKEAFRQMAYQHFQNNRLTLDALEFNSGAHLFWQSLGLQPYFTRYELDHEK